MWQFWIDVGGTFTDCLALSPDGVEHQVKVLSSGLAKGSVDSWGDDQLSFFSSFLVESGEPGFWRGAKVNLISAAGEVVLKGTVRFHDAATGLIGLEEAVAPDVQSQIESYELDHSLHSPLLAIREILGLAPGRPLPDCRVYLGTTRGTNALLTRTGAQTALVTTRGFRDLLEIGDQARPHLFELAIRKPEPLFECSIEINERILADGTVECSPDERAVTSQLQQLRAAGIESIAICLMHGYRYPDHEQQVGQWAKNVGFQDVRLSHEVAPLIKIVPRGETTVLDAYLNPVIGRYLDEIEAELGSQSQLRLMTSAGGLVSRARFSGKDSVVSGPAGGVVGAARIAEQIGFERMIGFDMGGTSTDVSRYDGYFEREYESRKANIRIVAPLMAIETVAAGGGSICHFDGTRLAVGPASSGADPGPACYGRGGPLSVTDINLYLGRIREDFFPFPLDTAAVEKRLQELCESLRQNGYDYDLRQLAEGFLQIANHNMSAAIRSVSVAKGYDPQDYLLVSFGGAGSQHCCAVAENLGMHKILDHPRSSILSAVGIQLADQTSHAVESVMKILQPESVELLETAFARMETATVQSLIDEGNDPGAMTTTRSLDLRFEGTDSCLSIVRPRDDDYAGEFHRMHERLFGYQQDRPVEIVAARVETCSPGRQLASLPIKRDRHVVHPNATRPLLWRGELYQAGLFDRETLSEATIIEGPAVIANRMSTTMVDPGWSASVLAGGQLLIEKLDSSTSPARGNRSLTDKADPVQLEIFNNHFSAIARQMGISLQKTSTSVNVKERLDFSCAIFTENGDLVVNAPHIPVHLGAMSETVRAVIRLNKHVYQGDVFVTNDPYEGGSHLPDITVVTPVWGEHAQPIFWVASRSHHAEIGGKAPGSMPANATRLGEEGVLIQNFKLIDRGRDRFSELRQVLTAGKYPSRTPTENLIDIAAQVAANRSGEQDLLRLVERYGLAVVRSYMAHIQDAAEEKTRAALGKMPDGKFDFSDALDNGATIRLSIDKRGSEIKFDFAGTDPVLSGNLNANRAIVSAAIMYVMRCLIAEEIPLNEGVIKPVALYLPECFLNPQPAENPFDSPAIVGGNVETSQRVVDVILGALRLAAASQGTMNNWLIGDESFGYYETVGGGSGATPSADGASAVHTHMTNTRLTDPEVLETRYPVVLREFAIRPGSGGAGRHRGGDGMVRDVEFRQPLTLSLLTNRRRMRPFGIDGGEPGESGQNLLIREDGERRELPSQCEVRVNRGDRLRLSTPGGGGFGLI